MCARTRVPNPHRRPQPPANRQQTACRQQAEDNQHRQYDNRRLYSRRFSVVSMYSCKARPSAQTPHHACFMCFSMCPAIYCCGPAYPQCPFPSFPQTGLPTSMVPFLQICVRRVHENLCSEGVQNWQKCISFIYSAKSEVNA